MMGFRPAARHSQLEVLLCCQCDMNIVVNAHNSGLPSAATPGDTSVISAVALRVCDAAAAYRHAVDRRDWAVPVNKEVMEHHIIAIHHMGHHRL